jgi:hypothetical protein
MSDYCQLENVLIKKLEEEPNHSLMADYESARSYLFKNIYPKISSILPDFTYHDGSHVINVLNNIYAILENSLNNISSETLYFLCLSALFHDSGLIFGREDHQKNIGEVYNQVRGGGSNIHKYANEKIIITKIVEAHTGKAPDDSNDTLKYLSEHMGYNEIINTKKLAAILKFADELAEGGQRTSDFFIEKDMYKKNSKIFHRYSQAYHSVITPKNNRLAITYNIIFSENDDNQLIIDDDITLSEFLSFIYERLLKVDEERKYCRYYCLWLESMKEISVCFNFWYNDNCIELGLEPLVFSDKIVPGDSGRKMEDVFPFYQYSNIESILRENLDRTHLETVS